VILDAQQDAAVAVVRGLPHVQRVDDVAEVQVTRGGWGKPCNHEPLEDTPAPLDAAFTPFEPLATTGGRGNGV